MELVKVTWRGETDKRTNFKGEGYTASLHLVPDQEIEIPDDAVKCLRNYIYTGELEVPEDILKKLNINPPKKDSDESDVKETTAKKSKSKKKFAKSKAVDVDVNPESSITDSVSEV